MNKLKVLLQIFEVWKMPFGIKAWLNAEVSRPAQGTKGASEQERWHLWSIHDTGGLKGLAQWLASTASARLKTSVDVKVASIWVDCLPVAWYPAPALGSSARSAGACEVGDVLLIVERTGSTRQGMLLQAKCTAEPRNLDPAEGKSTKSQRDFYEVNPAPWSIFVSGKAGAKQLGGPYNLPGVGVGVTLKECARYLLIPKGEHANWRSPSAGTFAPYQTLWPSTRSATSGSRQHFTELVLAMAGVGLPLGTPLVGGNLVPATSAFAEWQRFVADISNFAQPPAAPAAPRKISRFNAAKDAVIQVTATSPKPAVRVPSTDALRGVLSGALRVLGSAASAILPSALLLPLRMYAVPPGKAGPTPETPDTPRGMLLITVTFVDGDAPGVAPSPDGAAWRKP